MISHFKNSYLLFFVTLISVFFIDNTGQSQDTTQIKLSNRIETADIQWLGQWPSSESKHKADGSANRVKDFILGKKAHKLSKPVSILVNNQNTFWILGGMMEIG